MRRLLHAVSLPILALLAASSASAQTFGRNKVQYDTFDWRVLVTEHLAPDLERALGQWECVLGPPFLAEEPGLLGHRLGNLGMDGTVKIGAQPEGFVDEGFGVLVEAEVLVDRAHGVHEPSFHPRLVGELLFDSRRALVEDLPRGDRVPPGLAGIAHVEQVDEEVADLGGGGRFLPRFGLGTDGAVALSRSTRPAAASG